MLIIYYGLLFILVPVEATVVLQEHLNKWYSLAAYCASKIIVDLPVQVSCFILRAEYLLLCYINNKVIYLQISVTMCNSICVPRLVSHFATVRTLSNGFSLGDMCLGDHPCSNIWFGGWRCMWYEGNLLLNCLLKSLSTIITSQDSSKEKFRS